MSNTILEMIRSKNEEIEHLDKALAKAIAFKENNPKERIIADLLIKNLLASLQKRAKELLEIAEDRDGVKKEEIDVLAGNKNYMDSNLNLLNNKMSNTTKTADVWYNFYQKIKEIKVINKRDLSSSEINESSNYDKIFNNTIDEIMAKPLFNAEENRGKCVDMNDIYLQFLNLKKIREAKVIQSDDYLSYLSNYDLFQLIPLYMKKNQKYKDYLMSLITYFKSFFQRSHPLVDSNEVQDTIDDGFQTEWNEGSLSGWENTIKRLKDGVFSQESQEVTKVDPLFCIPCKKRFTNERVFEHHKTGKTHIKNLEKINSEPLDINTMKEKIEYYDFREEEECRELAYLEYQILRYRDLLGDVFENTKNIIRKKQSMNYEELEADIVDEKDLEKIEEDEDDEKPIFNPKNVPIGWDGKPIPYWLYKLHGLGVEYKCEICGGASYWGRKAFERHFQEWRHTYGMKCLKIPNTLHFKEVTSIEDALRLHQTLLENNKKISFKPEAEEEFEDAEGNVMSRKMYFDLKRQGLIN
jgi:splicing factor 3A subunit 3